MPRVAPLICMGKQHNLGGSTPIQLLPALIVHIPEIATGYSSVRMLIKNRPEAALSKTTHDLQA